ncbi:MAG: succinate dehydrogenase complex, subunit B [Watsoniomyces obsoletus]|nr:MAG: succinate dehydrogenase complex, subunit B [Watsoniomyces obsoletus]
MHSFIHMSRFGLWMVLAVLGYALNLADLREHRGSKDDDAMSLEIADCLAEYFAAYTSYNCHPFWVVKKNDCYNKAREKYQLGLDWLDHARHLEIEAYAKCIEQYILIRFHQPVVCKEARWWTGKPEHTEKAQQHCAPQKPPSMVEGEEAAVQLGHETALSPSTSPAHDRSEMRVNDQPEGIQHIRQVVTNPPNWPGILSGWKRTAEQNIKSVRSPTDLNLPRWSAALRSAKILRPIRLGLVAS